MCGANLLPIVEARAGCKECMNECGRVRPTCTVIPDKGCTMKTELLGVVLTLATTCFLLWVREIVVTMGKKGSLLPTEPSSSRVQVEVLVPERDVRPDSISAMSRIPEPSPIQVAEFLAELRTK